MSIRAIWVISLLKEEFGNIIFHRCFPTVEKKCKAVYEESYASLPAASLFAHKLLVKLQLIDYKKFVEWRDNASGVMQLPVVELNVSSKTLWPVVVVTEGSYLVCCVPFVANYTNVKKDNFLQVDSVSVGFSFILGILNSVLIPYNVEQRQGKLIDLDNFLSFSMPFGNPSDVEFSCISTLMKSPPQIYQKKQSLWRPIEYRGKQVIYIKITEFVRCILSAKKNGVSDFEIFGQVSVKADLDARDVSFSINSADPSHPLMLNSFILHPCVVNPTGLSHLGTNLHKRLRFSPPSHKFVLFHYTSLFPTEPPIQGVFKMLGENNIELVIQLKLNEYVKNSFDFCDLVLVFFNRGPVKTIEANVSHGSQKLSEDKYTLKWTFGTKFTKDLEAILTAKVDFQKEPLLPSSDPFCVDKNCYAQINFRQSGTNLSGCNIDPKSVTVSEGNKPKIIIERSVQSTEYRIWNSYGDVPFPVNIKNRLQKMSPQQ